MSRLGCLVACCAVVALAGPARAQDYPSRIVMRVFSVMASRGLTLALGPV